MSQMFSHIAKIFHSSERICVLLIYILLRRFFVTEKSPLYSNIYTLLTKITRYELQQRLLDIVFVNGQYNTSQMIHD